MNGIHDLGGMHGFGPIRVERDEPVFHAEWEGRVFALAAWGLGLGWANIDAFRHAIERLDPVQYLATGYYGRWVRALQTLLVEAGMLTDAEVAAWLAREAPPAPRGAGSAPVPPANAGARRDVSTAPRFRTGQTVRTHNIHPAGHTRLPRYVRGKCGSIAHVHPAWVFPDTNAHDRGEHPQYAYAVRFTGTELWGSDAEANTAFHVDLFESYLEPDVKGFNEAEQ